VTVEAGKTYRLRVINVGSLTYQARPAAPASRAAGHAPCRGRFTARAEAICGNASSATDLCLGFRQAREPRR